MDPVPAADTREVVGELNARGFPSGWIGKRLLIPNLETWLDEQRTVPAEVHARFQWLSHSIGNRHAGPDDHVGKRGTVTTTKAAAFALGYMPMPLPTAETQRLMARERALLPGFDRNGAFSPRHLPGHQFERNDTLCGSLRDALAMVLLNRYTKDQIVAETGVYDEQLLRMRRRLGMGLVWNEDRQAWCVTNDVDGAIANAQKVSAALEAADDVTFECLRQGVVAIQGQHVKYVPHVSQTHPAALAFQAWCKAEVDRLKSKAEPIRELVAA